MEKFTIELTSEEKQAFKSQLLTFERSLTGKLAQKDRSWKSVNEKEIKLVKQVITKIFKAL